jgi:hypothetical protein
MRVGKIEKIQAYDEIVYSRRNQDGNLIVLIQVDSEGYFCHILCPKNEYEDGEFFKTLFKAVLWSNEVLSGMGYEIEDPFLIPDEESEAYIDNSFGKVCY